MEKFLSGEIELKDGAPYDTEALSALYEYYFPRVYNYIYARVGERYTSEDLVSQVFEKVVDKIDSYKSERGRFSTWFFTIAQNTITDHYRKNRHQVEFTEVSWEISSKEPPVDELMILDEYKKDLLKSLYCLSERERNIISLRFWAELTNTEIAKIVNESDNNVAVILYRAIRRLKALMEEHSKDG